jgi:hypothetical protein
MKRSVKILSLAVCTALLSVSCRPEKPEKESEINVGIDYTPLTNNVESNTNSYIQVGDSVYKFNSIEGIYYCYMPTFNNNAFYFRLMDSAYKYSHSIMFEIFTEVMQPEIFFQKGVWKTNTLYINNEALSRQELSYRKEYYDTRAVLTWDTVSYENRNFKGKGSFEIMETLYTDYPEIYYPPQKIEFEFK